MGEVESFSIFKTWDKNVAIIRRQSEIITFMEYGCGEHKKKRPGSALIYTQTTEIQYLFERDATSI